MRTSETITKIAPALVKAQTAIMSVRKDKTGKIQTKTGREYEYSYSDLASVIAEVKPALNANGIVFLQAPSCNEHGAVVTTTLLHESGEWISEETYIPASGGTAQAYGSAITYAKRYGLQSLIGLPSEDDDGNAASANKQTQTVGMTARQVGVDEFAAMSPDEQRFIMDHAAAIEGLHRDGKNLYDYVGPKHFTQEELLALGSCLSSDIRSKLKRDADQHRAAKRPSAMELASQA